MTFDLLPGGDLIDAGLRDLREGRTTNEGLLVLVGAPRLRRNGIDVPHAEIADPERSLYESLQRQHGDGAHSAYNARIRLLVSFERALECANR